MADERFFDIFYDRFVASSPAVADRFRHTDHRRQKKAVRASLYLIMSWPRGPSPTTQCWSLWPSDTADSS
jgi:hypothetical protein